MITFNNLRVNSIQNNSGIFKGQNIQYHWCSMRSSETSFGSINGEMNLLEYPLSARMKPESDEFCLNSIR
jgi:hypothetical protein